MLKIDHLSVSVGSKDIVRSVSLNVPAGEVHLLLGPNGSGKSSLCMGLAGHPNYTLKNGTLSLDSKAITESGPEERARLGLFMSFQSPPAIPGLSVVQFLKTILNTQREKQKLPTLTAPEFFKTLYAFAEELHIPQQLLGRSLNENFSGGEKKKIEMLQMRLLMPKVALLDEPDSGVDLDAREAILSTVSILRRQKTAFLIVTHTLDFAEKLDPDFVYILQDGQIIRQNGPELLESVKELGFKEL